MGNRILVVDFGSQYTMLIVRRIRELGVYCESVSCTTDDSTILAFQPSGIILSGGPSSVYDVDSPPCPYVWALGVPVLGICYGMQVMVERLGGRVDRGETREYGKSRIVVSDHHGMFDDMSRGLPEMVWMSHGDEVTSLPNGFSVTAKSDNGKVAAMANESLRFYGLQFHPEVVHTTNGTHMLANFVYGICLCSGNWSISDFMESSLDRIRKTVGGGRVLCALSGGVDSSVVAAMLQKAVPGQVHCVFVDTGLSRLGEVDEIRECFTKAYPLQLDIVDARQLFFDRLRGITDPETKRKVIGKTFIDVFDDAVKATGLGFQFLAQGTLYPDVIESVSYKGPSHVIKSHHNVGGLPEHMNMALVEPLRELFKDEVRKLGLAIGLPRGVVDRQPFPGPGMAIRVLGEVTEHRVGIAVQADAIVRQMIEEWAGDDERPWQYFAVLLPVSSVGVMGDQRTYESTVVIRVVTSSDGMTADCGDVPVRWLRDIASRIVNQVRGVNRVVYDVTTKPPGTIEWE